MSTKIHLVDTILSTLGRDDGLRHAYLRDRWQGLADTRPQPATSRRPIAHTSRESTPSGKSCATAGRSPLRLGHKAAARSPRH
jgi:hypothetical protein